MTVKGYKVPRRSRAQLREIAWDVRAVLEKTAKAISPESDAFPIVRLLENLAANDIVELEYHSEADMGDALGRTYPDQNLILIREDVYLETGDPDMDKRGRARFTFAHEFGHFLIHRGVSFARSFARGTVQHQEDEDSEWQANCFAGELLVPYTKIHECPSPDEASKRFQVSSKAAQFQWDRFKEEGII